MTCAACVKRVERSLLRVSGVKAATVNLATETANVLYEQGQVDDEALRLAVKNAGYSAVAQPEESDGLAETVTALVLGSLMMLAMTVTHHQWHRTVDVLSLVAATIALPWIGARSFRAAYHGARDRSMNMHTLVMIASVVAYASSAAVTLAPAWAHRVLAMHQTYFESPIFVLGFVLLGKLLEHRSRARAKSTLGTLASLQPAEVMVVEPDGTERSVPVSSVKKDALFRARTGERVATDGVIVSGHLLLDQSLVTGESDSVEKTETQTVRAGAMVTDGSATLRATTGGSENSLMQMIAVVDQALASKAQLQRTADAIAERFVPAVLLVAIVTLAVWAWVVGDRAAGIQHAIAVLVVACPCALGLATPVALLVGVSTTAQHGILLKNAASIERAEKIDTVIFDKTGTLTEGRPTVRAFDLLTTADKQASEDGVASANTAATRAELVALCRQLTAHSIHPLSKAICAWAAEQSQLPDKTLAFAEPTNIVELAGRGIEASVAERATAATHAVALGSVRWMTSRGVSLDLSELTVAHGTLVVLALDNRAVAVISLADALRPEAHEAVQLLKALQIVPWIVSGDRQDTVELVAQSLGIEHTLAEASPEDKIAKVKALRAQGSHVAMVGDGINDAPALAEAQLAIAVSSATDIARSAADLTLVGGDLRKVAVAVRMSKRISRTIREGIYWAFAYNVLLIPVAAGVFARPWHVELSPALAAAAMSLSSVSVVMNALRLRRL